MNDENKSEHTAFAKVDDQNKQLIWTDYDDQLISSFDLQNFNVRSIEEMSKEYILWLGGKDLDSLQTIMDSDALSHWIELMC